MPQRWEMSSKGAATPRRASSALFPRPATHQSPFRVGIYLSPPPLPYLILAKDDRLLDTQLCLNEVPPVFAHVMTAGSYSP